MASDISLVLTIMGGTAMVILAALWWRGLVSMVTGKPTGFTADVHALMVVLSAVFGAAVLAAVSY